MLKLLTEKDAVRSLASQTRRQLILLGAVIFAGLVTLVTLFSFHQTEQAMDHYMRLEAIKLERAVAMDSQHPLQQSYERGVYLSWGDIPAQLQQLFSQEDAISGRVLEAKRVTAEGVHEYIYLLYSNSQQNGGLYVIDVEEADAIDALIQTVVEQTIVDASVIIGIFTLVFFIVIGWMFQRALRPLNLLVDWSGQIKRKPELEQVANFSIRELNEIAEHLLASLKQVKDYNTREQQFLKHASHELRTPLAIVQASLDTLALRTPDDSPNYAALQRAGRASANMILLTEALLWLARQSAEKIPLSRLDPVQVCEELIRDMHYLIEEKVIEVKLNAHSQLIEIEEHLFRIVVANLVRNAFQHSADGVILVTVTDHSLSIANPVEAGHAPSVQGFGLGLQLVDRIAAKLDWQFDFQLDSNKAFVSIRWQHLGGCESSSG